MITLSDLIQEEYRDRHCGTCARLGTKQGKYGPETYCRLDGKRRFSIAVQDEGKSSRWVQDVQDKVRVNTPLKNFLTSFRFFFKSLTWLDGFWYNINR